MVEKEWGGTTYGNSLMHRSLVGLLKVVDPRVFYIFAYIFILPPCVFMKGFRHAYRFFRNHRSLGPVRSFIMAYKNHCIFTQAVIDKFAMYAGRHFDIELEGYDKFVELSNQPEGFVQLSSHMGNYEIAGYSVVAEKKRFNALVYSDEKITVMDNRNKMFGYAYIFTDFKTSGGKQESRSDVIAAAQGLQAIHDAFIGKSLPSNFTIDRKSTL